MKRLRIIQSIYQLGIQIDFLRKKMCIDEKSFLYKIKNALIKSKAPSNVQLNKLSTRQLNKLKIKLEKYLHKLKNYNFIVSPLIYFFSVSRSIFKLVRHYIYKKPVSQSITNKLLIVFGAIPFGYRMQRPQHLLGEVNKKFHGTIIYVEPVFIEYHLHVWPIFRLFKKSHNIYLLNLPSSKQYHLQLETPSKSDQKLMVGAIKEIINKNGASKVLIKIDHPFWFFITENIQGKYIYDCMDDHQAFEVGSKNLDAFEKQIVKRSMMVFATSNFLYLKIKKLRPKKLCLLKNGCDYKHFNKKNNTSGWVSDLQHNKSAKIIGYFGAIAEWFDENIIKSLALSFPNDSIVLIGQVSHQSIKYKLAKFNNVHFLGEKPYKILPNYLQKFDVCLIPFVLNNLIKATNPVKIYEYFAAGKPVVSTNLPELQEYKDVMYLSKNRNEFIKNVALALKEKDKKLVKKRQQIAKQNTWEKRGKILKKEIDKLFNSI